MLAVVAVLVVSALDHRFGWSHLPVPIVVLGNVPVAGGLAFAQCVVIQNGYAAPTTTPETLGTPLAPGSC